MAIFARRERFMRSPPASPRIAAIACAVPPHRISQREVMETATRLFDRRTSEIERLLPAFSNAGVDSRYSCVPLEWYFEAHGWRERNAPFVENALTRSEDRRVGNEVVRTCNTRW